MTDKGGGAVVAAFPQSRPVGRGGRGTETTPQQEFNGRRAAATGISTKCSAHCKGARVGSAQGSRAGLESSEAIFRF